MFGRAKAEAAPISSSRSLSGEVDQLQLFDEPPARPASELPSLSLEPKRTTFGQRRASREQPALLLVPPLPLDPESGAAKEMQDRLSTWLTHERAVANKLNYYAEDEAPTTSAHDLHTAAEAPQVPYHPEDFQDYTLADDIARAMEAVKEMAVSGDGPLPAPNKDRERRANEILTRLHQLLLAEDKVLSRRLAGVIEDDRSLAA
jgi:cell division septation protein DedD